VANTRNIASDLELRILAVNEAMAGYPGMPATQKQLAVSAFVGASDDAVKATQLNRLIKGTRSASPEQLHSIHHALKLHELDLAFDLNLWRMPFAPDTLGERVREHREARAIEPILARVAGERPIFGFERERARVFTPNGQADPETVDTLPSITFADGEHVHIWVKPPIDGYLKLISLENRNAIGLDAHFEIGTKKFRKGERVVLNRSFVPRAQPPHGVFVAVMQAERFGPDWPKDHNDKQPMSEARCAELIRGARPNLRFWAHRVFVQGEV